MEETEINKLCPLRNFNLCIADKCMWYIYNTCGVRRAIKALHTMEWDVKDIKYKHKYEGK